MVIDKESASFLREYISNTRVNVTSHGYVK